MFQLTSPARLLHHHDDRHHPAAEPPSLHLPHLPQPEHLQCGPGEDPGHDLAQQEKGQNI